MKPTGPKFERETIVRWDEEDSFATVWTASGPVYNRMRKRGWFPIEDTEHHATFQVPKGRVRLPTAGSTKPKSATRGFAGRKK